MITRVDTKELNGVKTHTIMFDADVDQESDEPLDTINECIRDLFSIGIREYDIVSIDWRDPRTVEVSITTEP